MALLIGSRAGALAQGVVVESFRPGSQLAADGVQVGDVLLAWTRAGGQQGRAAGTFADPYDYAGLARGENSLGQVSLQMLRGSTRIAIETSGENWAAQVRPVLPESLLELYVQGSELIEGDQIEAGIGRWRQLLGEISGGDRPAGRVWMLERIGEAEMRRGDLEAAETAFEEAVTQAATPRMKFFVLETQGRGLRRTGEYQRAGEVFAQALELARSAGERLFVGRYELLLGIMDHGTGRLVEAKQRMQRALAIFEQLIPQSLLLGSAYSTLGALADLEGDLEAATHYWGLAFERYRSAAPGSALEADIVKNLGILAFRRGRLREAEQHWRHSLELYEKVESSLTNRAVVLSNLASSNIERGHIDVGVGYLERALAIQKDRASEGPEIGLILGNLGSAEYQRLNFTAAEKHYRRMLAIYQDSAPEGLDVAFALKALASVALERGHLQEAEDFARRAVDMQQRLLPESFELATSLLLLSELVARRDDLVRAEELATRALEIVQAKAPRNLRVANGYFQMAAIAVERGARTEARGHLRRALSIYQELSPDSVKTAMTLHLLGKIAGPEDAAAYFDRAVAAMESQIGRLGGSEKLRAGYRAHFRHFYRDYMELLLAQGQPAAAFAVLERSRARSFLRLLAERDLMPVGEIPVELATTRQSLAVRYERVQEEISQVSPGPSPGELPELLAQLDDLRRQYEDVGERIRRASPRLHALQYPEPFDLAAARRVLDPGTLLLSFSVGTDRSHLFALTADGPLVVRQLAAGESDLADRMQLLRRLIGGSSSASTAGRRRQKRIVDLGRGLYRDLLAPVGEHIAAAERLLILPDGPLHQLPWAILSVPAGQISGAVVEPGAIEAGSAEPQRAWRYLVEWRPFHLALSATVYGQLVDGREKAWRKPARESLGLVAFGDPEYPAPDRAHTATIADTRLRAAVQRGFAFEPLEASRHEVEQITALFPGQATAFLGREASEARAKAVGRETRYLHFAVHGVLDQRSPLDSALVLSIPESFESGGENGLLQAWEVFESIRLDADLVVLSSCQSALGTELGGEGLIGLTRAFQFAGARTVAASLWRVSDTSTQVLMVRFFRHLLAGQSKAEALRAAQLEMLSGETGAQTSSPVHWAAFQLYGDWR